MRYRVGILADDLTGAATMAGEFARYGAPAVITGLGEPPPAHDTGVWALNLACRDLDDAANDRLAREGMQQLARWGTEHVLVKIDSRLRGRPAAFLAPSLAEQGGALILQGHGADLQERILSPLGASSTLLTDPLATPRHTWSDLVAERRLAVVQADFPEPGEDVVHRAAEAGCPLWIGSYGLADALAGYLAQQSAPPVLVVAGSFSEATFQQIRVLDEHAVPHVALDFTHGTQAFLEHRGSYRERLASALGASSFAVLSSARARGDVEQSLAVADREGCAEPDAATRTARHVGKLIFEAAPANLAGLVLTGGATAHAVLEALDCRMLRVTGIESIGGAPLCEVQCEAFGRLFVVTKPGGLGGPPDLLRSLRLIAGHAASFRDG